MNQTKRTRLLLRALLVAALSFTVVACGGSDDDPDTDAGADAAADAGMGDGGDMTDGGETDGGETDAGETDGGETDGGETDGGETDGGETDGGETDATTGNSIVDIAVADGRFTTLVTALEALELVETFSGEGTFTVFAPTDEAFGGLPDGLLDAALGDLDLLGTVLNLHVLSTEVFAADIAAGESFVETLGGTKVLVVNGDEGVTVGGAAVRETDIDADNGVIHVMADVILPGSTISDLAANAEGDIFSTLTTALTTASLASVLAGDGDYMVFAPTNDAFAALPDGAVDGLLADVDALTAVLLDHVVEGSIASGDIPAGETTLDTVGGGSVIVNNTDGAITVNGVAVVTPDIVASNGIIHAIEGVLLPAEEGDSILDIAVSDDRFSALVDTLGAYPDLVELLDAEGELTVFAPTNEAFLAIALALEDLSEEEVRNVLEYHVVVTGALNADAVLGSSLIQMANRAFAFVDVDAGGTSGSIAGATIIETNIEADNGIIHVIDAVMLPPGDIPTVATEAGGFETLVNLLVTADLVGTLSGRGDYTVFAPTDGAFLVEPADNYDLTTVSRDQLSRILLSHVVDSSLTSSDVVRRESITALSGVELSVVVNEDRVTVGDANVVALDVPASNGVIHALSEVILGPDIITAATRAGIFNSLLEFLRLTELTSALALPEGPFTVFAPTDTAFRDAGDALDGATTEEIRAVLLDHVAAGIYTSADVLAAESIEMLSGNEVRIDARALTVEGAALNADNLDINTINGVIHVLDGVILTR